LAKLSEFDAPIDNEPEQVFFHSVPGASARLENPRLGVAMDMSWSADTLSNLAQWKSMASGDYALGLEPCNNYLHGRAGEREHGTLQTIPAFGEVKTHVTIAFSGL
jgi:hypothetical protein